MKVFLNLLTLLLGVTKLPYFGRNNLSLLRSVPSCLQSWPCLCSDNPTVAQEGGDGDNTIADIDDGHDVLDEGEGEQVL